MTGKHTIGVYPLLIDETCWFLAADFDKATWQDDCKAFLATCREMGVPAALERSRSAEDFPRHIGLPRGCFEEVVEPLTIHSVRAKVVDERFTGIPLDATFKGKLTNLQMEAAAALTAGDNGILLAATAFGKTVVGAWIVAARKVNTLVIVDRKELMQQWREKLVGFLDLPREFIGPGRL